MTNLFDIVLAVFYVLSPVVMMVVTWRDEREFERKFFSSNNNPKLK